MNWSFKSYEALSKEDLYDILALRAEVFVVEQDCPYQDVDYKDQKSHHVLARDPNQLLVGYTRIPAPDVSYNGIPAIGRVITKENARGTGLGHELILKSLEYIQELYGNIDVKLSAQSHLVGYYGKHGFASTGKEYLEDGIPHTEMLRKGI